MSSDSQKSKDYVLKEVSPGVFALEYQGEPKHYACPNCAQKPGNPHYPMVEIDDGYLQCQQQCRLTIQGPRFVW